MALYKKSGQSYFIVNCFKTGKPFLAKQVTAVDKNKIALKNSIKTMMLHDWKEGKILSLKYLLSLLTFVQRILTNAQDSLLFFRKLKGGGGLSAPPLLVFHPKPLYF